MTNKDYDTENVDGTWWLILPCGVGDGRGRTSERSVDREFGSGEGVEKNSGISGVEREP